MATTLEQLVSKLSEETVPAPVPAVKTAQDTSADEALLATVKEISEKTAADLGELTKIAADVAQAESDAMLEQAKLAGVALCEGFMERLAAYDASVKTASAGQYVEPSEEMLKVAYELGREDLEKEAQAAYEEGHEAALQEIHKVASEIHVAGQQSARNVLQALSEAAGGQ